MSLPITGMGKYWQGWRGPANTAIRADAAAPGLHFHLLPDGIGETAASNDRTAGFFRRCSGDAGRTLGGVAVVLVVALPSLFDFASGGSYSVACRVVSGASPSRL